MQQSEAVSTYLSDPDFTLLNGDVLDALRTLSDESVHMLVTSPPYWGLRDYGLEPSVWGGDPDCAHEWTTEFISQEMRYGLGLADSPASTRGGAKKAAETPNVVAERADCYRCGAWRGCLGHEPTPDQFVEHLVLIFREARRVLRKDGTAWLNLGDSYAANRSYQVSDSKHQAHDFGDSNAMTVPPGMKSKDLCMVPALAALALRADGWYLRSQIVWEKPNAMPESVEDRPTTSHEFIYLLAKSPRYFWDKEAVKEPAEWERWGNQTTPKYVGTKTKTGWMEGRSKEELQAMREDGRNIRTVWTIATKSYAEAHFATWPPELVELCIKAATSERGCCPDCGMPWNRLVDRVDQGWDGSKYGERALEATGGIMSGGTAHSTLGSSGGKLTGKSQTVGWMPGCECDDSYPPGYYEASSRPVPCTVLDIFMGSGTTAEAARKLGRHAIGIEKNPDYCALVARRTQQQSLLATEVA